MALAYPKQISFTAKDNSIGTYSLLPGDILERPTTPPSCSSPPISSPIVQRSPPARLGPVLASSPHGLKVSRETQKALRARNLLDGKQNRFRPKGGAVKASLKRKADGPTKGKASVPAKGKGKGNRVEGSEDEAELSESEEEVLMGIGEDEDKDEEMRDAVPPGDENVKPAARRRGRDRGTVRYGDMCLDTNPVSSSPAKAPSRKRR
ncbi:hypothetical protein LTR17_003980 [Elasticomyces elasticus]|nr:hypothetical protein LTR17_003980 [Elasticomyces elasticus]